ncbi:flagellar type III secretion system protein FlhB [Novosphingobium sp. FSY-8]|uniref:Flagellar type III secretion system protein FlhB n=1 Tax=Novosphingobium ovatum TaxID=1908523 RepID=A0ABW9XG42_9SPHN|nr:EscU/YscU/HrcU family type III secretion system export apparatus switch protein [Novosphingobium ovatum]NBC37522.1 flagellar type III secretion system protein FlhB [Novosphingobium ovatum]
MAEGGEKTHAPTPKRIEEAVKKGDVLRSRELGVAGSILIGAAFFQIAGPWTFHSMERAMRLCLQWERGDLEDFNPARLLFAIGAEIAPPILGLGFGVILITLITQLAMAGPGRFVPHNLIPKGGRLNPMNGLQRMFGMNGWIEVGKGLLKLALLGSIGFAWARSRLEALMELNGTQLAGQLDFAWEAFLSLLYQLGAGLVVIALADFPIQWFRRMQRLRMSLEEIREEHKQQEGSPEAKGAQKSRMRQVAMSAVAGAMKNAQFVVTNPTHFAIAIAYDPDLAPAPVVLARGRGERALAIRELAGEKGLPVLEYPGLARALYYTTRENQQIREELYMAVAAVLAFVMALTRGEARPAPDVDVPTEMRFDAEGRPDPDNRETVPPPPPPPSGLA